MYEEISLEGCISSIGGVLGLWVGMSFLTIYQGLTYAILLIPGSQRQKKDKVDVDTKSIYY